MAKSNKHTLPSIKKKSKSVLKKTQSAEKNTENYYQIKFDLFFKNSLNIVIIINRKGEIININKVLKGYKKEDVIGSNFLNYTPKEDVKELRKIIDTVFKTNKPKKYTTKGFGAKGDVAYFSSIATPIIENRKVKAVMIETANITGETIAKQELKLSEEKFKKLSDSAFEGIFIHQNGKVVQINKAITQLFNYTEKEIVGQSIFNFILPSYHAFVINKLKNKEENNYEIVALKKGKKPFWAEFSGREIEFAGQRARVVAIRDTTKNKEFQEQIEKSQQLYKRLIDASPDGIIIHQNGKFLFANPSAFKLMEAPITYKFLGKSIFDFVLPEYVTSVKKRIQLLGQKKEVAPTEIEIKTIKGKIKKLEIRSFLTEYGGKPAIQVVFYDQSIQKQLLKEQIRVQVVEESNKYLQKEIKERKIAEEKVYAQSAKLNAIIESSAHVIWTLDQKGCISSFNKNFQEHVEKNYGLKTKIGMPLMLGNAISSEGGNKFWIEKIKAAFSGESQHFETKLANKNGKEVWLDIFLSPIKDDHGKAIKVSGIGHDITEKKEVEQLIIQSLQEKEVLLKEVHHRVKNNLQLVSSILNLQSSYVKDEKILNVLKDSQNRIKSMSFIHESLYQTKDFSSINFSEYISELSKNLVHSYSNYETDVTLKLDIQNVFLNLDLAIPCGLIINEILSNALKYAFVEKTDKDELKLSMFVDKENLVLLIGDNGRGFSEGIDFKNTDSLGLQIVSTLVEQLSGSIELDAKQKGVNYIVQFQHNQIKNRK